VDIFQANQLVQKMQQWGIIFDNGLSGEELQRIESENNFQFPVDLRTLLMLALPIWEPDYTTGAAYVQEQFPNWRNHASIVMRKSRNYLFEGIRYAIEVGYETAPELGYWQNAWGSRPNTLSEALTIFEQRFSAAPLMIPVYGHRFIPTTPLLAGNPVFSIVGHDIIHYGHNLIDFFHHEFSPETHSLPEATTQPRVISFWDDFVYGPQFDYPTTPKISLKDIELDKYTDTESKT
jgi:hypothetical protein